MQIFWIWFDMIVMISHYMMWHAIMMNKTLLAVGGLKHIITKYLEEYQMKNLIHVPYIHQLL